MKPEGEIHCFRGEEVRPTGIVSRAATDDILVGGKKIFGRRHLEKIGTTRSNPEGFHQMFNNVTEIKKKHLTLGK